MKTSVKKQHQSSFGVISTEQARAFGLSIAGDILDFIEANRAEFDAWLAAGGGGARV